MPISALPNSVGEYFALTPPGYVDAKSLAASVAETFIVPEGARYVMFSANGDFYAAYNGTAAIATDTSDGTASELNPTLRRLLNVSTISVIAPTATNITAAFYS